MIVALRRQGTSRCISALAAPSLVHSPASAQGLPDACRLSSTSSHAAGPATTKRAVPFGMPVWEHASAQQRAFGTHPLQKVSDLLAIAPWTGGPDALLMQEFKAGAGANKDETFDKGTVAPSAGMVHGGSAQRSTDDKETSPAEKASSSYLMTHPCARLFPCVDTGCWFACLRCQSLRLYTFCSLAFAVEQDLQS